MHFHSNCINYFMTEAVIVCGANQWTGFYMIMASVMTGLKAVILRCSEKMLRKFGEKSRKKNNGGERSPPRIFSLNSYHLCRTITLKKTAVPLLQLDITKMQYCDFRMAVVVSKLKCKFYKEMQYGSLYLELFLEG